LAKELNVLDKRLKARYQRRFQKWKSSLHDASAAAEELGVRPLTPIDRQRLGSEYERIYRELLLKINQLRAGHIRPRGRPKRLPPAEERTCAKDGCTLPAAPGFIYCSRECAPCGHYGYSTRPRKG
jgi:hypothetical protein